MASIGVMEVDFRHGRLDNLAVHQYRAPEYHLARHPRLPAPLREPGRRGRPFVCMLVELAIVVGVWASLGRAT